MWWVVVVIVLVILLSACASVGGIISLPEWAKPDCPDCGGPMKWLKGQDSNSTGEAKFACKACAHTEFRGGWASEIAMETWEAKK